VLLVTYVISALLFLSSYFFPHHVLLLFQQSLRDDISERSKIIKQHEDNLKFLNSQSNQLAESIFDLQGMSRNQSGFYFYLFIKVKLGYEGSK